MEKFIYILVITTVFFICNVAAVWLWGIIGVSIFGLPALSFWEMFGLRLLLYFIFPSVFRISKE